MTQEAVSVDVNNGSSAEAAEFEAMRQADVEAEKQERAPEKQESTEDEPAKKEEKVVPLAALHEERQRRKEFQQRFEAAEAQRMQDMQRLEQRLQALQAPPQPLPDVATDPVANFDRRIGELTAQQQQVLQNMQASQARQEQQAQIQRLTSTVQTQEAQFAQSAPDYNEAVNHLREVRKQELIAFGYDEDQAATEAQNELVRTAFQLAAQGKNPAQVAYNLAKVRGYVVKTQTGVQKIEAHQKVSAASRSLGGGGAVRNNLTAEALLSMDDAEFDALSKSDWRKAMGG